jgi:hypothetical protein
MPKREVERAIVDYLSARNRFLAVAAENSDLLAGNDNIVGRIGEYLAIFFLMKKGRLPRKVKSKSEKGHDLLIGKTKVSVKLLTSENSRGLGLRLTDPWDELLLLELDTGSLKYRVGHLLRPQFEKAIAENPTWSRNPIVKKTMLGSNGLIGKYGVVETEGLDVGNRAP